MKAMNVVMGLLLGGGVLSAGAGDRSDRTVVGTLVGAGIGAAVSHNVDGVSDWVAVPLGALAGAALADRDRFWSSDRRYRRPEYRYASRRRYDGGCYPERRAVHGSPRRAEVRTEVRVDKRKVVRLPEPDRQPGVELIKVAITHSNGVTTEVSILKLGERRFVGPQGEEYDALPAAETLAGLYGM